MLLEFLSKKAVIQETKVDIEVSILEKTTFLRFKYSGGYEYYIKFIPSCDPSRKIYRLDYIYMTSEKIIKGYIEINPFNRFPSVNYNSDKKEFEYVGNGTILSKDYLSIISTYWLLQKRCDDCFFEVITEEQFEYIVKHYFGG